MKKVMLLLASILMILVLGCTKNESVSSRSPNYVPIPKTQDMTPKIDSIAEKNMKQYLNQKTLQEDVSPLPKKDSAGFSPKDTVRKYDNTLQETISKKSVSLKKEKPSPKKTAHLKK